MAYLRAQKFDYDSDRELRGDIEGFVDLYDLVDELTAQDISAEITAKAGAVRDLLEVGAGLIITAGRVSDAEYNLDDAHGLSIYFPLGEEAYVSNPAVECVPQPPNICEYDVRVGCVKLRDLYTNTQLLFAADTAWDELVHSFVTEHYCKPQTPASRGLKTIARKKWRAGEFLEPRPVIEYPALSAGGVGALIVLVLCALRWRRGEEK